VHFFVQLYTIHITGKKQGLASCPFFLITEQITHNKSDMDAL